jgi:hypothetical protein
MVLLKCRATSLLGHAAGTQTDQNNADFSTINRILANLFSVTFLNRRIVLIKSRSGVIFIKQCFPLISLNLVWMHCLKFPNSTRLPRRIPGWILDEESNTGIEKLLKEVGRRDLHQDF